MRLIDADSVYEIIDSMRKDLSGKELILLDTVLSAIKYARTAEKYGHWIHVKTYGKTHLFECSECHEGLSTEKTLSKYCSGCGARMQ